MIRILKQLSPKKIMIDCDGKTFLVSESNDHIVPVETLVFRCDQDGNVTSWSEVGGEIGVNIDRYMERLHENDSIVAAWRFEEDDLPW